MALSSSMVFRFFLGVSLFAVVLAAVPDKNAILAQLRKNGACCTALEYFLPEKTHFNDLIDLEYQTSQTSFWSAQERSLNPTCIVIPTTSQDVSTAVTILSVGYQASIKGCKFAVRGAGHTPTAGAANIDGGITIDMQSMNQVTVSNDRKTVSIGPGNRWGNIYPKLDDLDLAMVGGRVSQVGTGGLITGSGISFFSGRYGFACDNVRSFEVVLGNGTITTASSTSNPTLFRALKGGSNNFGIVTRIDSILYPQKQFWGGTITQPITNKEAYFDWFVNITSSRNFDQYAASIANFAWAAGAPLSIIQNVEYTNGDVAWPPPVFKPLDDMPKIATTVRKDKLSSFTNELALTAAPTNGRYNLFLTLTFVNKPGVTEEFMAAVWELGDATAKEFIAVVGMQFDVSFQPLPYAWYSKSAATGGNVLGLDRFTDDLANLLFTVSWQLPTDNARVEAKMQELEKRIVALQREMGVFNEFVYLNYAAKWQDPVGSYGQANVEFLRDVSRRYDPNGVFQKAVPGGFKLGI